MTYRFAINATTTLTGSSFLSVIMQMAHQVRRVAALKYGCQTSEIMFGECLRIAWGFRTRVEAVKERVQPAFKCNASGFVQFHSREFGWRGDKGTWARYDASSRQLTICRAAQGLMSEAYEAEMRKFAAAYGIDFAAMSCGTRQTVTL